MKPSDFIQSIMASIALLQNKSDSELQEYAKDLRKIDSLLDDVCNGVELE